MTRPLQFRHVDATVKMIDVGVELKRVILGKYD